MDDESDELHQFSVKLFDKNGMVKPEIVDHEFHKGSGVWGRELNHGMMIYVDTISVKPEVWRQRTCHRPLCICLTNNCLRECLVSACRRR